MSAGNGKGRPRQGDPNPNTNTNGPIIARLDHLSLTVEQSQRIHVWLADAYKVPADRLAYIALVEIADGKFRRRPYLTLAGAQSAVDRAEARGVQARITLCELRPLGGAR